MGDRKFFLFIVIVFILAPGVHYFVAGEHLEHSRMRNILVGVQIVGGLLLLFIYGRKGISKHS